MSSADKLNVFGWRLAAAANFGGGQLQIVTATVFSADKLAVYQCDGWRLLPIWWRQLQINTTTVTSADNLSVTTGVCCQIWWRAAANRHSYSV